MKKQRPMSKLHSQWVESGKLDAAIAANLKELG